MDVALTFTWFANRPNIGLMGVHLMRKALDVSIAHARTRAQFGSPIGRFQLVQEMLAEMSTALGARRAHADDPRRHHPDPPAHHRPRAGGPARVRVAERLRAHPGPNARLR